MNIDLIEPENNEQLSITDQYMKKLDVIEFFRDLESIVDNYMAVESAIPLIDLGAQIQIKKVTIKPRLEKIIDSTLITIKNVKKRKVTFDDVELVDEESGNSSGVNQISSRPKSKQPQKVGQHGN